MRRAPAGSTLFPYTTLFRSVGGGEGCGGYGVGRTQGEKRGSQQLNEGTGCLTAPLPAVGLDCHTDHHLQPSATPSTVTTPPLDRKSTRLKSSHLGISYAGFC